MIEHFYSTLAGAVAFPVVWGVSDDEPSVPRASVFRTGETTQRTLDGAGPTETRVQVSVFGETVFVATTAAEQIKAAMANYRGGPILDVQFDGFRDGTTDDAGRLASVIILFTVMHTEE